MIELDPVLLARIQFAANMSFHILFPSITIGLAWLLVWLRVADSADGNCAAGIAFRFWLKIFALSFALGVVSGITMSFQFGTNWPGFMESAGNIAGPLLGYEVLTAFFLESTFLAVMLFGRERVSARVYSLCCVLVAMGTSLSAFWILSLGSWMQTPQGYRLEDGALFVESWKQIIFNPSFPYRLAHMFNASLLTSAFLVIGVCSWQFRKSVAGPATAYMFRLGMAIAMICAPLQLLIGDLHGLNTLEHQPAKIAAIEAVWETSDNVPFVLFALPDAESRSNRFAVEIPYAASWILTHDRRGVVQGLNEFEGEQPPVAIVFWAFRLMLAIGTLMIVVSWWGGWQLFRRQQNPSPLLLTTTSWMTFSGWVAVLAGWYVTEIGRQPWLVYGVLRSQDMVAGHSPGLVLSSLIAYLLTYLLVLVAFVATLRYLATRPVRERRDQADHEGTSPAPALKRGQSDG